MSKAERWAPNSSRGSPDASATATACVPRRATGRRRSPAPTAPRAHPARCARATSDQDARQPARGPGAPTRSGARRPASRRASGPGARAVGRRSRYRPGPTTAIAASTVARYSGARGSIRMKPMFDASAARMSGSCAPLRRARSAPCGSVSCRLRVTGPELRIAEPDEQIGALGVGTMHCGRHVERDAVVVRRLGRCELFERLIAGERRPPLRRVGPAGTCAMPRELDHDVGPDVLGALLERAGGLPVQADAKRSPEVGVQRIGDERVHEPRRSPHRPGVDQEAGTRCGIERFDHDRLRKPDHVDEHVLGELDTEHRRRGQDARRIGTERVDPAPHDVAQARRYVFLTRGRQVGCGDARVVEAARLDPVPDELRCVERVAGGLDTQRGGDAARLVVVGSPARRWRRDRPARRRRNRRAANHDARRVRDRPARLAVAPTRAHPIRGCWRR